MRKKKKKQKKLKKKNPVAKLLRSPMLRNKIVKNKKKVYEDDFVCFAYRYKYVDGEYSAISPYSDIAFVPGFYSFNPLKGFNDGMENKVQDIKVLDFIPPYIPDDVECVDLLFKNTNSTLVHAIETFKRGSSSWNTFGTPFSSYKGNGNANGTFVYTGFKPAFVMCKRTDGGTQNWCIMDNKRGYNPDVQQLHPNTSGVETLGSGDTLDLLSNGFKMRATDGDKNGNGETFIYMAIGQSLVGSNNVPCTGV